MRIFRKVVISHAAFISGNRYPGAGKSCSVVIRYAVLQGMHIPRLAERDDHIVVISLREMGLLRSWQKP